MRKTDRRKEIMGDKCAQSDWMARRAKTDSDGNGDKPDAKAAPPPKKAPGKKKADKK